MIVELNVKDFAIVKNINLKFHKGLNVLTGETGTGKSIILEALNMLIGQRASKDMIKKGKDKAYIEGLFFYDNLDIENQLLSFGIEPDLEGNMIITREIHTNGRSVSRINGSPVTLNILNTITQSLIDIHGQHEHQSLLNKSNHIRLIDSFSRRSIGDLSLEVKNLYGELLSKRKDLSSFSMDDQERDRNLDLLHYQIKEIEAIDLETINEEELFSEYNLLSHTREIESVLNMIIYRFKDEDGSIIDSLNKSIYDLDKLVDFDPDLGLKKSRLMDIYYELEDIQGEIRHYLEAIRFDEERYNYLEDTISYIENLKRKYGSSLDEIMIYKKKIQEEVKKLENSHENAGRIKEEIEAIELRLLDLSLNLSKLRKKSANLLREQILLELRDLNMEYVDLDISFKEKNDFSETGIDDVEFLISTNLGEDLKPLSDIASGGEISRIMLAFKNVFADYDEIDTLIFDEIDTGISGNTANLVGRKIKDITKKRQVILVSHLPQIASLADNHFLIEKVIMNDETESKVRLLKEDERILEISRLIGGDINSELSLKHAEEMLLRNI